MDSIVGWWWQVQQEIIFSRPGASAVADEFHEV
jgi:hypothetical protein